MSETLIVSFGTPILTAVIAAIGWLARRYTVLKAEAEAAKREADQRFVDIRVENARYQEQLKYMDHLHAQQIAGLESDIEEMQAQFQSLINDRECDQEYIEILKDELRENNIPIPPRPRLKELPND